MCTKCVRAVYIERQCILTIKIMNSMFTSDRTNSITITFLLLLICYELHLQSPVCCVYFFFSSPLCLCLGAHQFMRDWDDLFTYRCFNLAWINDWFGKYIVISPWVWESFFFRRISFFFFCSSFSFVHLILFPYSVCQLKSAFDRLERNENGDKNNKNWAIRVELFTSKKKKERRTKVYIFTWPETFNRAQHLLCIIIIATYFSSFCEYFDLRM